MKGNALFWVLAAVLVVIAAEYRINMEPYHYMLQNYASAVGQGDALALNISRVAGIYGRLALLHGAAVLAPVALWLWWRGKAQE